MIKFSRILKLLLAVVFIVSLASPTSQLPTALFQWSPAVVQAASNNNPPASSSVMSVGAASLPLLENITAISAGYNHTCALTTSGGVKCWGNDSYGELGNGQVWPYWQYAAKDVVGLTSGVVAIAAGDIHTCALTSTGGVKCWGDNQLGEIGDGTTTNRTTPVDVVGLTSGVKAISSFGPFTCALTNAGGMKCWGSNRYGELGDGTYGPGLYQKTPKDVPGLTSGVKAIAAGWDTACALTTVGGVKCWGDSTYGQVGNGVSGVSVLSPADVYTSGISSISVSGTNACAVTVGGAAKCWGANFDYGELGIGTTVGYSSTPVDVSGLSSGISVISAGSAYVCAMTTGHAVYCWGKNYSGQVGVGNRDIQDLPVAVTALGNTVSSLSTGNAHACVVTSGGTVKCWGADGDGQLGIGIEEDWELLPVVVGTKDNAQFSLVASPNPVAAGQAITLTATLSGNMGAPTGWVVYYVDGVAQGSQFWLANGANTLVMGPNTFLPGSTHVISATYAGDAVYQMGTTTVPGGEKVKGFSVYIPSATR